MAKFFVYAEFYGKKLKIEVDADNEFRADNEVRKKLHIIKIVENKPVDTKKDDGFLDELKNIFGMS